MAKLKRPEPVAGPAVSGDISPAMTYALMTGEPSDARLRGWVRVMQEDPAPDVAWTVHRERLIAEAASHDFRPFALTHQRPTGEGFERWEAAFLKR